MDANLAGFVALGALIVGLFAWLRMDIREIRQEMGTLREEIGSLRAELADLRERVARIEGLLEAVFMRRDLTPLPEPPPSGGAPGASKAA